MQLSLPVQGAIVVAVIALLLLTLRVVGFDGWMEKASDRRRAFLVVLPILLTLVPPDTFPAIPHGPPTLPKLEKRSRRPIVIIGADGLDWRILRSALRTGTLPHLEATVSQGVTASLDNNDYGFSPPVWTSFITGQGRNHHQIYDFVTRRSILLQRPLDAWWEKIPPGFGIKSSFNALTSTGLVEQRLADGRDRRGPSVWQILSAFGYRSLVVNYQVAQPPERINGIFLLPGASSLTEALGASASIPVGHLSGLSPKVRIELALAEVEFSRQIAVVAGLMKTESFDLVTFYTPWTDSFNHMMSVADYERAVEGQFDESTRAALIACYASIDRLVEQVRAAQPEANIIIVSDHGVGTGYKYRQRIVQHVLGCPGVFAAQGPDVAQSGEQPPVSMYDLTPTILAYFGAPLAKDFEGKPRADILTLAQPLNFLTSYYGAVANRRRDKATEDGESISERLKALGYIQ